MPKFYKHIAIAILWLIPTGLLVFTILLRADVFKSVNQSQPFELISDMDNGLNLKPQSRNIFAANKGWESLRPENSVPISGDIYRIEQNDIESSVKNGDNPLPNSELVLKYGKYLYETHCVYCHNHNADGMGAIVTKVVLKKDEDPFPNPPDIRNKGEDVLPDSRIFHILSAGQNLMYPVSHKLNNNDKWAIIKYLRTLQNRERNAK